METTIVWLVVATAALWYVRRLFSGKQARRIDSDSCSGNCSSCAFAAGSTGCATAKKESPMKHGLKVIGAVLLAATLPSGARAADTIETWDPGAFDVEGYVGLDGVGMPSADRAIVGETLVGYGLAERLAAYVAGTLQTDGVLENHEPEVRVGLFGTPLDTERFDLDLLLEVGAGGAGFTQFQLSPGVEANLDLASPLGPWGLYLRAAVPLGAEEHVHPDGSTTYRTGHAFELNPGLYWNVADGHQLLVEYAVGMELGPGDDAWENHGAALGYNVGLNDTFELITQATLAPADGAKVAAGLMVGFIATLPDA